MKKKPSRPKQDSPDTYLEPWVKPFQNLRSTRETELMNDFPIQVACEWIGSTQLVAQKDYLQVTEEHFKKAVQNAVHLMRGCCSW